MLYPRSRWICAETSGERVGQLAREANISPLLARMLIVRGIDTAEQIHQFLHADMKQLHEPFLMAGMAQAVERIQRALKSGEKIRIYGDYDADGVSSTSLMIYLMQELKANFDYYIPHRTIEGYGLNNRALDDAKAQGCTLIVTVDTGISAVEQVAYAKELGIDVVITDHHEPPEQLPDAYALVNPKLPYCAYPFKGLAGAGVAFKVAQALLGYVPEQWLELAAIGTVADLMPLLDENRVIVQKALMRMKHSQYAGIRALITVGAIDPEWITSTSIAFSMAPRINASGRLDHANIAVQLLTAEDDKLAFACAVELDRMNKERQKIVEHIMKEAEVRLEKNREDTGTVPSVIVLAAQDWNVGVIGIVASKIVERYYRPTFVLGIDPETGMCKGSARSIPGFDLYEAMTECAEVFAHFGGHQAAAGMTIHRDRLPELERRLNETAVEKLTEEDYIPHIEVDAECELADVPLEVIEQLERLAPFGMGNPSPRVVIRNAVVRDKRTMGKEGQHLKLMLGKEHATLDAVAFHRGALSYRIAHDVQADILGELSINEWNGQRKPQLMMQDIRIAERQLFDHRSTTRPLESAIELARVLVQDEPRASALLMMQEQAGVYAAEPYIWLYSNEPDGPSVIPSFWGGSGDESTIGDMSKHIHELVLCSIPPSENELKRIAQQLPNVSRIHAILPQQPEGGRLLLPTRERMTFAYSELRRLGNWDCAPATMSSLAKQIRMNERELQVLLEVFKELDFITCILSSHHTVYSFIQQPKQTSLEQSQHYREWMDSATWESRWYEPVTEDLSAWLWSYWKEAQCM